MPPYSILKATASNTVGGAAGIVVAVQDDADSQQSDEEFIENALQCEDCEELTSHEVLRERKAGTGTDFLVKCSSCGKVKTIHFRPPQILEIPFMLTEGATSSIENIEIEEDEYIGLEEIFEHEEKHWRITRLELKDGETTDGAVVKDLVRATALRADVLRIKITMTEGEDSIPDVIDAPADKMFHCGAIMHHDGKKWRIRAIHTGGGRTLNGSVRAARIKRIYLHEPPAPEDRTPRTPRERRQAWKEGRLGQNPNPIKPPEQQGKGRGKTYFRRR